MGKDFPYKVKNFRYNGVFVEDRPGYTDYRCRFESWTDDPGIAKMRCDDGAPRLIPTCQLRDCDGRVAVLDTRQNDNSPAASAVG